MKFAPDARIRVDQAAALDKETAVSNWARRIVEEVADRRLQGVTLAEAYKAYDNQEAERRRKKV